MPRPKGSKNKEAKQRVHEDVMKPQEIDFSQPVRAKGGMAHSLDKKEDNWGGKVPPFPRSELNKTKESVRSGLALIRE